MGTLSEEDKAISEGPLWEFGKEPEPISNQSRPVGIASEVFSFITSQFNKFNPKVRGFVRWSTLVVAITFGANHGSEQFRRTVCHWDPYSTYFCENPRERISPTEDVFPTIGTIWFLSTKTWLLIITSSIFLLGMCVIIGGIAGANDAEKTSMRSFVLGLILSLGLFVISIGMLITIVASWF